VKPAAAFARAASLLACAAGAGCMSFVTIDSARTAPPGGMQVLWAPSFYAGDAASRVFNMDVMIRRGLGRGVDAGARVNLVGLSADVKLQLHRAPDPTSGVDVAIAPGLGVGADLVWSGEDGGGGGAQAFLPLLVGVNLGTLQLLLAPQLRWQQMRGYEAGIVSVGGTVAFGWIEHAGFRLYPVVAAWKAFDPANVRLTLFGPGGVVVQPAVVLRWGS
jgi:hypothetical protein